MNALSRPDRKSTRLNSSHTEIYTLSLHDALPISGHAIIIGGSMSGLLSALLLRRAGWTADIYERAEQARSEEHTSELQSHRDLHSFPTRRSSDLGTRDYHWRLDEWPAQRVIAAAGRLDGRYL